LQKSGLDLRRYDDPVIVMGNSIPKATTEGP